VRNKLKCDNDYCIYNKKQQCILDEVGIDAIGMCDSCIILSLDEELLDAEKTRQLREIGITLD
jgi:hypothetical protein